MWSPIAPALGIPSVARAEHHVPVRALPVSQFWDLPHKATEATQYQGETRDNEATACPILPHGSQGPSILRCPKDVQPLLMTAQKGDVCRACSALTQPWQLKPGPAESFTCQCLSHWRARGTVPAGALPRELPKHRAPAPPLATMEKVG